MQSNCETCGKEFEISQREISFLDQLVWKFGDTSIHTEQPSHCPDCRLRKRLCHRNEKNLYRHTTDDAQLISIYAQEPLWEDSYTVYSQDAWHADTFDAITYGREFDFSRPFFEQWAELHKQVPRIAVVQIANENSEYSTGTGYCKNCYILNSSENCEDCLYGKLYQNCKDIVDSAYMYDSEMCYQCFNLHKCSRCTYVYFSQNSHDCLFSSNLKGCSNCCLCSNLDHKEYYFENQPLSREEYEEKVREYTGSHTGFQILKEKMQTMLSNQVCRAANIVNSENCTGDFIEGSSNSTFCFDLTNAQDCMYTYVGVDVKDLVDCCNMYLKSEMCYDILGTIEAYNCAHCLYVFHSQNMLYSDFCFHSSDCFGCCGLKRKKYCILNRQYTEEQYNDLVPKIVEHMRSTGEWGQFFPSEYSPFGYDESLAQEYMPLDKEAADRSGFHWRDHVSEALDVEKTITASQLPDHIDSIPNDILNWAIECEETQRPFRIVKRELDFYRTHTIPIPHVHPDVRYEQRMQIRNPRELYGRTCHSCGKDIQTTYAPERLERIVCEECYLNEVY